MTEQKLMSLPGGRTQCKGCVLYHYFKYVKVTNATAGVTRVTEYRGCRAMGHEFPSDTQLDDEGYPIVSDCTMWQKPRSI